MNRRDFFRGAGAGVAVAAGGYAFADEIPFKVWTAGPEITAQKYIELPLRPGDEIVAMTTFRDEVIIATKHGEIFRLQPTDFR